MSPLARLLGFSTTKLVRLASVVALVGLAVMAASVLWPRPLPVIFAMSVGHVIGFAAFALYLAAVVVDARRAAVLARKQRPSLPPGATSMPPPSSSGGEPPPAP